VTHGANLVGQLDSRQDQVSASKAKKRKHKKTNKKSCEKQHLATGSEGVAAQQPGSDPGIPVVLAMVGGVVDDGGGGYAVPCGAHYPCRYVCGIEKGQLAR